MKTKRIISGLLSAMLCVSMLTACTKNDNSESSSEGSQSAESSQTSTDSRSEDGSDTEKTDADKNDVSDGIHILYIRDAGKSKNMVAVFYNSMSGKTKEVTMTKSGEGDDYCDFTCEGDVNSYNMVSLKYDSKESEKVSFNEFVGGYYLWNDALLPCSENDIPTYDPKFETKVFKFRDYDKNVYIWTPDDYDPKSEEKYSTVYMLDGQSVLSRKLDNKPQNWHVSEFVTSMMSVTDNKAIVVAIETMGSETTSRDEELVPNIGGKYDEDPEPVRYGNEFSDFIADTIIPYVEKNYNVYTDAKHNCIAGSSIGGIGAFYIGLDHPEKFGTVGALSSSFWTDDAETWKKFLGSIDYSNVPFMYMYAGAFYEDMGYLSELVYNNLLDCGYPKDKIVFHTNETGTHDIPYWRSVYPEFLEAAFTGKVTGIETGARVRYKDRSMPGDVTSDESSRDETQDTRPDSIKNYIFYDNSETKWDKVCVYWWSPAYNKVTGQDFISGDWPGVEMEKIEGTDIYRLPVPVGATQIIFNSGVSDDLVMKGTPAYQTIDLHFNSNLNYGQIYKIDINGATRKGTGIEKTKLRYSEGTWTDVTEEYGS